VNIDIKIAHFIEKNINFHKNEKKIYIENAHSHNDEKH
jgi:hypothetical protein